VFSIIQIIWRHGKVVRQRSSCRTQRHSFVTTYILYSVVIILYQTI
jgi:hypothetical protein